MNSSTLLHNSKRLSWLLRHGANASSLSMDAAGWAPIADVLAALGMSRAALDEAVAGNDKSRLEVRDGRIRAAQGHSLAGTPVTLDGLEASWERVTAVDALYHGTFVDAVAGIAARGILPIERTHVHMVSALDSKAGKRANVHVMLEVSPARLAAEGIGVFRSPNGVLLVRRVPAGCITGLLAVTASGRARAAELRAALGLPAAP